MESDERRFKALDFLLDYSKGTLWWVKDRLWAEADESFVVKRKGHPGLSIAGRRAESLYSYIPMLIGTTRNPGRSLQVKNLDDPTVYGERVTHFNVVRPHTLRFDDFGRTERIRANDFKPRIDKDERLQLDKFLFGREEA